MFILKKIFFSVQSFKLISFPFQACNKQNSSTMACPSPNVKLPKAFESWDSGANITDADIINKRRKRDLHQVLPDHILDMGVAIRHRRNAEDVEIIGKTVRAGDEELEFYLGFQLDNVKNYENLSDTIDMYEFGQMVVYSEAPEVTQNVEFPPFVPGSGQRIRIPVNYYKPHYSSHYRTLLSKL